MKILLLILLLLKVSAVAQVDIIMQNPFPHVEKLNKVFSVANFVYAVGDNGIMLKSTDAGSNWITYYASDKVNLYSLFMFDPSNGWAGGEYGKLFRISNGAELNEVVSPSNTDINSIFFINDLTGIIAGSNGTIFRTSDGGGNWISITLPGSSFSIADIKFTSPSTGFICGEGGNLLKSTDSGVSWNKVPSSTLNLLSSIHFPDTQLGYAAGMNGTLIKTSDGGTSWVTLSTGFNSWLKDIYFSDNGRGVAVTYPGSILLTTDGGSTWSADSSVKNLELNSIHFSNNNLWIAGDKSIILKSVNTGDDWELLSAGFRNNINDIIAINQSMAIAVGDNGLILKTIDKGITWYKVESGVTEDIRSVDYYSPFPRKVVAAGTNSTILESNDYGETWHADTNLRSTLGSYDLNFFVSNNFHTWAGGDGGNLFLRSGGVWSRYTQGFTSTFNAASNSPRVFVADGGSIFVDLKINGLTPAPVNSAFDVKDITYGTSIIGWIACSHGTIIKTENIFRFDQIKQFPVNSFFGIKALNKSEVYAVGTAGSVYRTTNGGDNWAQIPLRLNNPLYKVTFAGGKSGWATGSNGLILRIENNSSAVTDVGESSNPISYSMLRNYPNPFNPSTVIHYSLPEAGEVSIKIYDLLGNEIIHLVNEYQQAGVHSISYHAAGLTSGIYFCKLTTNKSTIINKMLLVK